MKNHTLMQTIARANRVFGEKNNGLIVDYVGVFRDLQKALVIYGSTSGGEVEPGECPIQKKDELIAALKEATNRHNYVMHQQVVRHRTKSGEMPRIQEADGEGFDGVSLTACPTNGLPHSPKAGEAESEAVCHDSGLKAVVEAWPTLPHAIKAGILAMVQQVNR